MTGEPWSKTGRVVNFEQRPVPEGDFVDNVHVDVEN